MKRLIPIIAALLLLCCGCDMLRFETAEEIRRREEEQREMAEKTRLEAPVDMLTGQKTISRELKNDSGAVLARYEGAVPTFFSEGYQEAACQRMNEFFEAEFAEYTADCDAFFESVKRLYGEEWATAATEGVYTTTFAYELLDTPLRYICVKRTYTYARSDGSGYVLYYPEIFLAENGWHLKFNDLFGLNAEPAASLVMEQIEAWCLENQVPHERLDGLTVEDFRDSIAMTREHLIIYVQPFTLSTNDKNDYEIQLDMRLFKDKLTEPIDE